LLFLFGCALVSKRRRHDGELGLEQALGSEVEAPDFIPMKGEREYEAGIGRFFVAPFYTCNLTDSDHYFVLVSAKDTGHFQ
jgi:hypothetical protein